MTTMTELSAEQCAEVSGGWLIGFFLAYGAGKAMDAYGNWVQNGAGGWTVEYDPDGYSDPLL